MLLSDYFYILVTVSSSNLKARFVVENVLLEKSSFLQEDIAFSRAISSSLLKLAVSLSWASICCWMIWIRFVDSFNLVGDFVGEFAENFLGLPASLLPWIAPLKSLSEILLEMKDMAFFIGLDFVGDFVGLGDSSFSALDCLSRACAFAIDLKLPEILLFTFL